MDLTACTITEARILLDTKQISARELADAHMDSIAKHDTNIHAYLEVYDDVRAQADSADARLAQGKTGPLVGIPLAMKDNILVEGKVASAGSKMLEHYVATYDATVSEKLKAGGAVFLGRTNMDEFAMGSSTETSAFCTTKNPRDLSRVPGGSSGGSAAAVAGGMALGALGSDTGGSIRQPAALCGLVGLKPTYGSVSRFGLIAMGSSLDVIGPLTRSVADSSLMFEAIRGHDRVDSATLPDDRSRIAKKERYTIGVPRAFLASGVDPDVLAAFEEGLALLVQKGHTVVDIELPTISRSLATYYIIMPAEVSTNMARFDGVRYGLHVAGKNGIDDYSESRGAGLGKEVRRRILLGTYVLSSGYYDAYYGTAMQARERIRADMRHAFEEVDAVALPTTPSPAFRFGEKTNDPLAMYLEDVFTVSANIIGIPALSVPCGTVVRDGSDLPVGFQLMAPALGEATLFALGALLTGEADSHSA
ncbi:MAG: Asp-tRNA(Asn)/Glu-tRNA(Gln) amidotransferase subunit GatA [Candidatus Pacebacteria bacterium]|nr:Asp-tRNA(Asn)/Glu-tRNA(Gln) amidotransferase subunit GatA [Candidatus Paceibacterota bacterium]